MRRIGFFSAAFAVALAGTMSFAALANSWQGTWIYYNAEGAQIGRWTAGCGAADGRWGDTSGSNKRFTQGCAVES
ncbi:DUF6289 family protein [Lysobacter enzymogenes]|uniref:Uncharacterized protein n=1 Tax=Lysobacter enzymogenes TaxID=69 RepID=A0A3N2RBG4_LYSEN|nr:DUF6289 family protein [Lysobacter enzymogenes]ROU04810.1 hypothetical protein D9T17_22075 [Lysobacter enzymogenes]